MANEVRWTIKVGEEVDVALRVWLGSCGSVRKGDLSKYVEEAVTLRLFGPELETVRDRLPTMTRAELQAELPGIAAAFRRRALNRNPFSERTI